MPNNPPKLYIIGDSISLQYGPFLERMVAGRWQYARKDGEAEAMLDLDNPRGANGGDSSMVRSFLTALVERGEMHVDLMLINCGLHDIKANPTTGVLAVDKTAYAENLKAIIELSRKLASELIWIETTHVDDELHAKRKTQFGRVQSDVQDYNAIAQDVMIEHDIAWLPLGAFSATLGSGADVFRDGVHFHEPVQQLQAAYIAGWLEAHRVAAPSSVHT